MVELFARAIDQQKCVVNPLLSYDVPTDTWSKWPGKAIYLSLAPNQLRGIKQAPVLNGKAYIGLGYQTSNVGNKEWWSFAPYRVPSPPTSATNWQ